MSCDRAKRISAHNNTRLRGASTSNTPTSEQRKTIEEGGLILITNRQQSKQKFLVLVGLIIVGLFSLLVIYQQHHYLKTGRLSNHESKGGSLLKQKQPSFDSADTSNSTSTARSSYSSLTAVPATKTAEAKQMVVVSMKTMPSRIKYIKPTLKSLLFNQTIPLDRLYIVLPQTKWAHKEEKLMKAKQREENYQEEQQQQQPMEGIQYKIPNFLHDLIQRDERVIILRPQYDFGPVDKMLYALEELEKESATADTTTNRNTNTNLIYLDDDIIYDENVLQNLVQKGIQYPDSVVAFSGCTLRSHFRQIEHRYPRSNYDRHPNLYYRLSGTESLPKDEIVDIVQGFMGVLVRPHFFHPFQNFISLVKNVTDQAKDELLWKSDDSIISAYLEQQNVTRRVVVGGVPPNVNTNAARKDNLGTGMHRQVMHAVYDLQHRLDIWRNFTFVNYMSLGQDIKDIIECETGRHPMFCKKVSNRSSAPKMSADDATNILDKLLL